MNDLEVTTEAIASRTPALALQEVADRDRAQMIVVGSCHRGPVGRTLAGSVGESLLHGASCSVAIAPHGDGERDQDRVQRIAVAFDGSSESWAALETAIGLAERCHATVTAIAVADYPTYGYATAWTILTVRDFFRDAERADKQRLLDLATSRIPAGLQQESRVLTGEPAVELRDVSGEFDLMVAGSRRLGTTKAHPAWQHDPQADPLMLLPGFGPAACRRRRPARCSRRSPRRACQGLTPRRLLSRSRGRGRFRRAGQGLGSTHELQDHSSRSAGPTRQAQGR